VICFHHLLELPEEKLFALRDDFLLSIEKVIEGANVESRSGAVV
jgi:hypothetical protein